MRNPTDSQIALGYEAGHDKAWHEKWGDDPAYVAAMEIGEQFGEEAFQRMMEEIENEDK